jgi:protease-4
LPLDQVMAAAKGQVWSGEDAKALGLVDALGGLVTARNLARQAAGIAPTDAVRFKIFPEERDPFEALFAQVFSGELRSPALAAMGRSLARAAQALAPLARALDALTGQARGPAIQAPELRPAG